MELNLLSIKNDFINHQNEDQNLFDFISNHKLCNELSFDKKLTAFVDIISRDGDLLDISDDEIIEREGCEIALVLKTRK